MGLFDKKPRSKEQVSKMRLNMRIVACFVLGYFSIQMFQAPLEDTSMTPLVRAGIALGFLLFAVIVGGISIREYFRLQKEAKNKALEEANALAEDDEDDEDDEEDDYEEDDGEEEDDDDWEDEEDEDDEDEPECGVESEENVTNSEE